VKNFTVNRRLTGLIAVLLVIFLPSLALAQDFAFGVSPTEVQIANIPPGQAVEFELSIRNKDEAPHIFTIAPFHPPEDKRREGRAQFPDDSWISVSPREIELPAGSESSITVAIAIPPGQEWASHDWEIWLGVVAQSDDLLALELYVRLLVSTGPAAQTGSDTRLVAGTVAGLLLLGGIVYYHRIRRKAGPA